MGNHRVIPHKFENFRHDFFFCRSIFYHFGGNSMNCDTGFSYMLLWINQSLKLIFYFAVFKSYRSKFDHFFFCVIKPRCFSIQNYLNYLFSCHFSILSIPTLDNSIKIFSMLRYVMLQNYGEELWQKY